MSLVLTITIKGKRSVETHWKGDPAIAVDAGAMAVEAVASLMDTLALMSIHGDSVLPEQLRKAQ